MAGKTTEPVAIIGDIHGCIDELRALIHLLHSRGITRLRHAGDLVDRGPDSEAVIQFCLRNKIPGVMGNHDAVIVELYRAWEKMGKRTDLFPTKNTEKQRTLQQLSETSVRYLESLPYLEVFDDLETILVHGGLYPRLSFHHQLQHKNTICRLQMIKPHQPGETRWFNTDRKGRTEKQNNADGFVRWYHVWDHPYRVVFGHTVFEEPMRYQSLHGGECIGVDTGSCFGGSLTAVIIPEMRYLIVKAKRVYMDLGKYLHELSFVDRNS